MVDLRMAGTKEEIQAFFDSLVDREDIEIVDLDKKYFPNQVGQNKFYGYIKVSILNR